MIIPRMFALTRPIVGEIGQQVVAYGMELPDGFAISVPWPTQRGQNTIFANSAKQIAELNRTDIQWIEKDS